MLPLPPHLADDNAPRFTPAQLDRIVQQILPAPASLPAEHNHVVAFTMDDRGVEVAAKFSKAGPGNSQWGFVGAVEENWSGSTEWATRGFVTF